MQYVFVSGAEEDEPTARLIVERLQAHGVEVFWFLAAGHRGSWLVEKIERAVERADLFLVLLSPSYLASEWCGLERRLAVQREIALARQFVYVLEVAPTPTQGVLTTYDRIDASPPLDGARLDALVAALPVTDGGTRATTAPAPPPSVSSPDSDPHAGGASPVPQAAPAPNEPRSFPRGPVVAVAAAVVVLLIVIFAVTRTGTTSTPAPTPMATTTAPPSPPSSAPPTTAATGNILLATPAETDGCTPSYVVSGTVGVESDRRAAAIWIVAELYASPSHNDPNDLYFAKARVALDENGAFTQRIAANDESGVRDGRYVLVASPDAAASEDLALSLDSNQKKDDRYPDVRRTALQMGNVEIASSADLHQDCP